MDTFRCTADLEGIVLEALLCDIINGLCGANKGWKTTEMYIVQMSCVECVVNTSEAALSFPGAVDNYTTLTT